MCATMLDSIPAVNNPSKPLNLCEQPFLLAKAPLCRQAYMYFRHEDNHEALTLKYRENLCYMSHALMHVYVGALGGW